MPEIPTNNDFDSAVQALWFDAKVDNFRNGHILANPTGAAILQLLNNQSERFSDMEKKIADIQIENEKLRVDNHRLASSKHLSQIIRSRALENFKCHKMNVE